MAQDSLYRAFMQPQCPKNCRIDSRSGRPAKYGSYYRTSDRRKIQRYRCAQCGLHFSQASHKPEYRQKKRHLNHQILTLYVSGVSQNRMAKLLRTKQRTIAAKIEFLGLKARLFNYRFRRLKKDKVNFVQFDDLETFEHTKLKPVSVTLAVEKDSRFILGFEVARMPAKGLLAKKSRKKYGYRKDDRAEARDRLFRRIKASVTEKAIFLSDQNPHYPESVRKHFPKAKHITVKGQRGAITGQGELKKINWDPLFSLNHTCAMFRANANRLFRKTWCTTKKLQPLIDHLELYVYYHNQYLLIKA